MTHELINTVLLDRYRVLKPLPESGAGLRYLARDERAEEPTPVVVETVLGTFDGETLEAFEAEVEQLRAVDAPGVVRLLDAGEVGDMRVLVHEYVHGYRLAHWHALLERREERFPVDTAVYLATSIAGALADLHQAEGEEGGPLLHGELTPSAVLVREDGAVKLTDFQMTTPSVGQTAIGAAQAMTGKYSLLAPELVSRKGSGPQSDIYGAGLILYILVAGDHGLAGDNMFETLKRVMDHTPTPLAEVRDDVPGPLSELIARVLAKKPEERPADAATFARELEAASPPASKEAVVGRLREDFGRIPQELGLPALEELEQSWSGAPSQQGAPAPAPVKRSREPRQITASGAVDSMRRTTLKTAPRMASRAPRLSRQQLFVGGLIAAALVLAALVAIALSAG